MANQHCPMLLVRSSVVHDGRLASSNLRHCGSRASGNRCHRSGSNASALGQKKRNGRYPKTPTVPARMACLPRIDQSINVTLSFTCGRSPHGGRTWAASAPTSLEALFAQDPLGQTSQGIGFDLSHSFPRQTESFADLLQRLRFCVVEPEPHS
jgi:hypothetical protein